ERDTGSVGIDVIIKGKTGHPTSTLMKYRKDALIKASEVILAAQEIAEEFEGTLTIENMDLKPHGFHIISQAKIHMVLLHQDNDIQYQLKIAIQNKIFQLVEQDNMEIKVQNSPFKGMPAKFSENIINEIEKVSNDFNYPNLKM